ncbi:ATP synthase subunit I [Sedimentibacter sp. zth1]|uniref:ATP synthase subunit I n=1 Tax=Sedimentibacter sp. zth1 TaxID=2816908 RepID=UPI001A929439|nr:ATP synthase subunit I [Sedimentibacter sp. zth1]QSX05048.1 ATP synthase subunit I [Sedimentibacter sp. zth1]
MNKTAKLQYKIILIDVIVLIVLIILALFFTNDSVAWIKGYIFGGLIGILNFLLLGQTVKKVVTMSPRGAKTYATANYFVRLTITAVVLIIALKANYLNAISVIIGLLLIKYIIYFSQIFNNKSSFKRMTKRKEEK